MSPPCKLRWRRGVGPDWRELASWHQGGSQDTASSVFRWLNCRPKMDIKSTSSAPSPGFASFSPHRTQHRLTQTSYSSTLTPPENFQSLPQHHHDGPIVQAPRRWRRLPRHPQQRRPGCPGRPGTRPCRGESPLRSQSSAAVDSSLPLLQRTPVPDVRTSCP